MFVVIKKANGIEMAMATKFTRGEAETAMRFACEGDFDKTALYNTHNLQSNGHLFLYKHVASNSNETEPTKSELIAEYYVLEIPALTCDEQPEQVVIPKIKKISNKRRGKYYTCHYNANYDGRVINVGIREYTYRPIDTAYKAFVEIIEKHGNPIGLPVVFEIRLEIIAAIGPGEKPHKTNWKYKGVRDVVYNPTTKRNKYIDKLDLIE